MFLNPPFDATDIVQSLALFYLIILTPYSSGIFTCYQKKELEQNKWMPFILGFFLFYFLVILISQNTTIKYTPPLQKFFYTFVYYFLFILTTRLDNKLLLIIVIILFISYFIELNRDYYLNTQVNSLNKQEKDVYLSHQYWITLDWPIEIKLIKVNPAQFTLIDTIEKILYGIIAILVAIGIIAYAGEIKDNFKNKTITWEYIFTNVHICNLNERKSIFYYVKKGLGIL